MSQTNNNYQWLDCIPPGWAELARKMIKRCKDLDSEYQIYDLKEKWGALSIFSNAATDVISNIEQQTEELSEKICCCCGQPATKYSTGWVLPWCDECGKDEEKYYKRMSLSSKG